MVNSSVSRQTLILSVPCLGTYHSVLLSPDGIVINDHVERVDSAMLALGAGLSECKKAVKSLEVAKLSLSRLSRKDSWPIGKRDILISANSDICLSRQAVSRLTAPANMSKQARLNAEISQIGWDFLRQHQIKSEGNNKSMPDYNKALALETYARQGWSQRQAQNFWSCGVSPTLSGVAKKLEINDSLSVLRLLLHGWSDEYALAIEPFIEQALEHNLFWTQRTSRPYPNRMPLEVLLTKDFSKILNISLYS